MLCRIGFLAVAVDRDGRLFGDRQFGRWDDLLRDSIDSAVDLSGIHDPDQAYPIGCDHLDFGLRLFFDSDANWIDVTLV